jgi:hypothetical protein
MANDSLTLSNALAGFMNSMSGPPPEKEPTIQQHASRIQETMVPQHEEIDTSAEDAPQIPDAPPPAPDWMQKAQSQQQELARVQAILANEAQAIKEAESAIAPLRHANAGEYALKLMEINKRQARLDQEIGRFNEAAAKINNEVASAHHADYQRKLQSEAATLEREIPNWGPAAAKELRQWLKGKGYSDAQLDYVSEAKTVRLLWDAFQVDKGRKKTVPTKKRPQIDPRQSVEEEIRRANLPRNSERAAAMRIQARMQRG